METRQQLRIKSGLKAGMTNPASSFCVANGGNSIIVKDNDGNEYGLCHLPDNKTYEEWSYFNTCSPQT
jgi:putative hemolysin